MPDLEFARMARTDTVVSTLLRMERTAAAIHSEAKGVASHMQGPMLNHMHRLQLGQRDLAAEMKSCRSLLRTLDAQLNRQEERLDALSSQMARLPTLTKLILAQAALFGVMVALAGVIYGLRVLVS